MSMMRRWTGMAALLWGLSGCAARSSEAPAMAPALPAGLAPRDEIRVLSDRIAAERAGLGLPPAGTVAAGMAEPSRSAPPVLPEAASSGEPPGTTAPAPAERGATSAREESRGADRCQGVCRAGRDICTCSARICRLAEEIQDQDSRRSCQRSQKDCSDARRLCSTCQP